MRQPDDPEAIAERIRAFRLYLERVALNPQKKRGKIAPLIQPVPTREDLERMWRIVRGERFEE